MCYIRPGTIDLLVRFSADSNLIGPTKLKKGFPILFFSCPPDPKKISLELLIPQKWFAYQCLQKWTRNITKMILSKQLLIEKLKRNGESFFLYFFRPTLLFKARLKIFFYFTVPPTPKKRPEDGMSTKRSNVPRLIGHGWLILVVCFILHLYLQIKIELNHLCP